MTTEVEAIGLIEAAADRLVRQCEGTVEPAWSWRPASNAWSVADVVEHVTISHGNTLRALGGLRALDRATQVDDVEIPYLFYRGEEPTGIASPTGAFLADRPAALRAFADSVARLKAHDLATHADLRGVGRPHPMFEVMDGIQWLLFTAAHLERHRAQIIGLQMQIAQAN
jgi:DinB superfamily